ncbi:peroxidase family protein [Archangium sp.]|uniref:peroxidase family protein n=1 Tax=Archangium sp. TaxID=1872627 RepID=UPI00389A412F
MRPPSGQQPPHPAGSKASTSTRPEEARLPPEPRGRIFTGHHGVIRGSDLSRRSPQFEGRFGRMFRTLPAAQFDPDELAELGKHMVADFESSPTPEEERDDEENPGISAGFTYLGQFMDHDLTFDPTSSLERENDPDGLVDFRTPRFDLDSVYGRGPDDQPYLYRDDGLHMLLGAPLSGNPSDPNARDLPRNSPDGQEPSRALIGDPRNDENVIVAQLQTTFIRFHNSVVDYLIDRDGATTFLEAQRLVRWHYQWVILHDFLPTIIGEQMVHSLLPHLAKGTDILADPPHLRFYKPIKEGYIPIEFAAAAYRFGHSMVRPTYRINESTDRLPIFTSRNEDSLVGFGSIRKDLAIDWRLFFPMGDAPLLGKRRIQPAYKLDTALVNPLGSLPHSVAGALPHSLATRNLLRGLRMGLPSGQDVARLMGVEPIADEQLRVGKANEADFEDNPSITEFGDFAGNAPLWFYVLAEAMQQFQDNDSEIRLGPVGGRIVGEVIIGLMLADNYSFFRQSPRWRPIQEFRSPNDEFKMADLIRQTQNPVV